MFVSCRTEEFEFIDTPEEETLQPGSEVSILIQQVATNDGSGDNIIDQANCFNVVLPIMVFANGIELQINSEDDFDVIESIFDEFEDDDDSLQIEFPITIVLTDFRHMIVNSTEELAAIRSSCNGENEEDDDIECLDFQYPITASVFNTNSELIETIVINNDKELFDFIDDIDEFDVITIQFPISVILLDETVLSILNLVELEDIINFYKDDCDEDDDYDFNDDDCNDCSDSELASILTACDEWYVDKLERNDEDLEELYVSYRFSFASDGILNVTSSSNEFVGTWTASGIGNNITVNISIAQLPDFNNNWLLNEINSGSSEQKVDLRLGDDRLRFETDCVNGGGSDDMQLRNILITDEWVISYSFDDTDNTSLYTDYTFIFSQDETATATNPSGTTTGTWSIGTGNETALEFILNFGTATPLGSILNDWDVLEVTNDIIRLKDIDANDMSVDFLTFSRPASGGGGGGSGGGSGGDLSSILIDGLWFVASYTEDNEDQTSDYNGYNIDFNQNGTVVASNGSNTNSGTWAATNADNVFVLDFGTDMPFEEFNDDDWDVISVSETQVILRDVSGGNGGIDVLTLQKI